ncbi:Protein downstream neighbor of son -like protein [Collichthys lucidus]|uniref:Protein downstream neighbor of son-like protein n=1 Tax=Collichthys lucidus TaxID=240159 RepID=A0A4U5TWV6_COLLU|nr:Protein downstream neighbor of son -like protein [Collichthys lucidus]
MSQPAGYSPSFKRPAEIMRMRRRRRARSDAGVFSSPSGQGSTSSPGQSDSSPACVRPFSPGPLFNAQNRSGGGIKRRNPFANIENTYSPKKKLLIYNDDGDAEAVDSDRTSKGIEKEGDEDMSTKTDCPGALAARLAEAERQEHRESHSKKCLTFSEDDSLFEEEEEDVKSPLLKSPQAIAAASIAPPVCTQYPADWSLKTRLLFTSPLPLSWAEHPKAQEEALGLSQHCRAQFATLPHSLQDPKSCSKLRCAFQQSLVYWQHPSLPWINLFPRINAERNFSGKSTPWAQDTALQQSLMSEWSVSLSSLYSLLKARLCPYFYVCSYQFTVLFRAAGLGNSSKISALIAPTTRGFREAMKAEGIEFSLPLVEERRKSREQQNMTEEEEEQREKAQECSELKEDGDCQEGDDGENDDEDGSFSWLKEMGVQDKIKKPDSITIQLRKEGHTVSLDHKPESVVCVEGSHTFTLINFLINCKSVVAAAGPILPSSLHSVTTLLRPAQKGNFSATLYTHAPTAVMNTHTTKEQGTGGSVDLSGCGLHPASVEQLQQPSGLGKTALTHISMNNYSYTWKN